MLQAFLVLPLLDLLATTNLLADSVDLPHSGHFIETASNNLHPSGPGLYSVTVKLLRCTHAVVCSRIAPLSMAE